MTYSPTSQSFNLPTGFSDHPGLSFVADDLLAACRAIATTLEGGGCLFLCGNGGSLADALHISGELLKSYLLPRPLPADLQTRLLAAGPDGGMLAHTLQGGLRAHVLGLNHALSSAVENDLAAPALGYAQELLALARPGDMLLGLSTSGDARNVCYAAQVARALGLTVISLTGESGGRLASLSDIAIRAPASKPDRVQELHIYIYHCLCEMLEVQFFGSRSPAVEQA